MSLFSDRSRPPRSQPDPDQAPVGRATAMPVADQHTVLGNPIKAPFGDGADGADGPNGLQQAMFGMGCFWGAERGFWKLPGVYSTAVGYAAGYTPNPSYQEVCGGRTGHNEVVLVVFDPALISYPALLAHFWQSHDPTQGMGQGNDRGTQYRSGIYTFGEDQQQAAEQSQQRFQQALAEAGMATITTEIIAAPIFYYAEDYHQQYLDKNPAGYCGLGGTGVCMPAADETR